MDGAAARNPAHVIQLRARVRLRNFPLARELADDGFGLLVDLQLLEVALAHGFEEPDVGGVAMFPVPDQLAETLHPLLLSHFVIGLEVN